jgi:hypothetical protein
MSKFIHAAFQMQAFNCPYCSVYAKMEWSKTLRANGGTFCPIHISTCSYCSQESFWFETFEGGSSNACIILPEKVTTPIPHQNMPEDVKTDFLEAASILSKSPKGASALLRLSIQKLCIHLGEGGKNINDDIGNLVKKGLPVMIQQALDVVRVVGNNAVHPGEINDEDFPEVAIKLFELVNFVVDDRIAKPAEVEALYKSLPHNAKKGIEKRDTSK